MKLRDAVVSAQRRLDDEDGVVWTTGELELYAKDGYDLLCRRSKCLFDIHVIDNVPQTGNWSTDLERYLGEQKPGFGLTDARLNFTAGYERDNRLGGQVGGSVEGPTPATSPHEGAQFDDFDMPTEVATGRLPNNVVDVVRVTWDEWELTPENSRDMRRQDIQYERREGGDPRHYTMDKDGLMTIRLVPPARGDADYPTVVGSWGIMTQTDDSTIAVSGSWGFLRESEGAFPAGGPHGTPTRMHPALKNTNVEIARLGRPLTEHLFEIPEAHVKYVIFWMMHRALKKAGPGQDLKLAKHYSDRFELGISRMKVRLRKVNKELILRMGIQRADDKPFGGMGDPQLPYPYGPGRKI